MTLLVWSAVATPAPADNAWVPPRSAALTKVDEVFATWAKPATPGCALGVDRALRFVSNTLLTLTGCVLSAISLVSNPWLDSQLETAFAPEAAALSFGNPPGLSTPMTTAARLGLPGAWDLFYRNNEGRTRVAIEKVDEI